MNNDPREVLATSPMTRMQILVVAITIGLTGLDGFDVLSISFASRRRQRVGPGSRGTGCGAAYGTAGDGIRVHPAGWRCRPPGSPQDFCSDAWYS